MMRGRWKAMFAKEGNVAEYANHFGIKGGFINLSVWLALASCCKTILISRRVSAKQKKIYR